MDKAHVILEVITIIIGLYLAFFKSYFSEKGKNIATKEDIGEITSKVEAIKTEFIKETEHLKIELQFKNVVKTSVYNDTAQVIIQQIEALNLYNTKLEYFCTHSSSVKKVSEFKKIEDEISVLYHNCILVRSKTGIYVKDQIFLHLCDSILSELLAFNSDLISHFYFLETMIDEIETYQNSMELSNSFDKYKSNIEGLYIKKAELHRNFIEDVLGKKIESNNLFENLNDLAFKLITSVE